MPDQNQDQVHTPPPPVNGEVEYATPPSGSANVDAKADDAPL
jgi:hypothetical protein